LQGLLELIDLRKDFGALAALDGVNMTVNEGSLHSIIGPNGAGKTTLFNCITGELEPSGGRILFAGRDITGFAPHRFPALGISRSFQRTSIFPKLTVAQNVWVPAYGMHPRQGAVIFNRADAVSGIGERIRETLVGVGLESQAGKPAEQLSHGDQRLLDLAIALASRPRLLLLDEPTAGLSRSDTHRIIALVERLKERYTLVLIEHKMDVVMRVSDRISVMVFGKVLAEGSPAEIGRDPRVREAYLGKRA
jgi:branched-chain amino acid transport system ATP-binding protein